jgi:hypothetical protein
VLLLGDQGLVPRTTAASFTTGMALTSVRPALSNIVAHADIEMGRSWNRIK